MLDRTFELLEVHRDDVSRGTFAIAIDSTALGPAFGGIRCWRYASLDAAVDDVLDLARAMSRKCALAGVPGGGGKAVLVEVRGMDRRAAFRALGRAVQRLGGRFYTGPDVGTGAADLAEVAAETCFVARPDQEGPGDLAHATALGVFSGIETVARRLGFGGLPGVRIAVQGVGAVGSRLVELLAAAGARLCVADLDAARARRVSARYGARVVDAETILAVECDVLAPCALGAVIDDDALERLHARAVAGAANNVLASPRQGRALHERGVLYAPDFVLNAGALIHGALFHLEGAAPPPSRVHAIGAVLGEVLDRAAAEGLPPELVAERIADERLAAARVRRGHVAREGP